ncbi:hypothetical protein BHE74_00021492, partial [Ensete ventricosum]
KRKAIIQLELEKKQAIHTSRWSAETTYSSVSQPASDDRKGRHRIRHLKYANNVIVESSSSSSSSSTTSPPLVFAVAGSRGSRTSRHRGHVARRRTSHRFRQPVEEVPASKLPYLVALVDVAPEDALRRFVWPVPVERSLGGRTAAWRREQQSYGYLQTTVTGKRIREGSRGDTDAKEEEEKPKSDPKKMTQIFGNRAISPLRSLPGMSELRRRPWASGSDLTKPTPLASHKEPRQ